MSAVSQQYLLEFKQGTEDGKVAEPLGRTGAVINQGPEGEDGPLVLLGGAKLRRDRQQGEQGEQGGYEYSDNWHEPLLYVSLDTRPDTNCSY